MTRPALDALTAEFRRLKRLGDGALAQLADDELRREPGPGSNSVAVLVQHLAGNMVSRWTDFLESDGDKPGRDRDAEFEDRHQPRAALLADWERGWATLFAALEPLADADLARTVVIRGEAHTAARAVARQLAHYGQHVGQIIYVAKLLRGDAWQTLSIPRGESAAFNRAVAEGRRSQLS